MSYHALVIDDDEGIREDVEARLDSLGHTCDCVGCQYTARERLDAGTQYAYILLDLQIPLRYGKKPLVQNGKNLLNQIRQTKGIERIPVIVMTAHGLDGPDLAVEVFRDGRATDFVKKPFPSTGETLEKRIAEALSERTRPGAAKASGVVKPVGDPQPFESGEMVFFPTHVELCGVKICGATGSSLIRRILDELRHRNQHGRYVRYDGTQLAKRVKCDRGQNGVAESVRDFRNSVCEVMLEEANITIDRLHDVILNDRKYGYRLSSKITVRDGDDPVNEPENDPDDTEADPVNDPEDSHWNHRQKWIMDQLRNGHLLQKCEVRSRFKCSDSTAKRDLNKLSTLGLIEFVGPAKTGHYRLKPPGQADFRII